ncbi:MAG: T9SS type A sorting domain-containing protein [Hymenobacter sp.]|nr:T9SS type A sorting domain-containing protein [Hymenobacter sp.]
MQTTVRILAQVVFALLLPVAAMAQAVPNGNMENWAVRAGSESPVNWLTADDVAATAAGFPVQFNTTIKAPDARGGSFAARLENKAVPLFGVAPGLLILGSRITGGDGDFPAGLPYTGRPARMEFYYKLAGTAAALAADSAAAFIVLTRTVNGQQQVIAAGETYLLTPAASYALSTVPLRYASNLAPDSLQIIFASALSENAFSGVVSAGTALTIDDIALTGTVAAARNPALEAALTVYPNPSPNREFRLASPGNPAVATAPYTITDATGHVVRTATASSISLASGRPLELRGLPAGVYLLQLRTPDGPLSRKLLIP